MEQPHIWTPSAPNEPIRPPQEGLPADLVYTFKGTLQVIRYRADNAPALPSQTQIKLGPVREVNFESAAALLIAEAEEKVSAANRRRIKMGGIISGRTEFGRIVKELPWDYEGHDRFVMGGQNERRLHLRIHSAAGRERIGFTSTRRPNLS